MFHTSIFLFLTLLSPGSSPAHASAFADRWLKSIEERLDRFPRSADGLSGPHFDLTGAPHYVAEAPIDLIARIDRGDSFAELLEYVEPLAKRFALDPSWILSGDWVAAEATDAGGLRLRLMDRPDDPRASIMTAAFELYVERRRAGAYLHPPIQGRLEPDIIVNIRGRDVYLSDLSRADRNLVSEQAEL